MHIKSLIRESDHRNLWFFTLLYGKSWRGRGEGGWGGSEHPHRLLKNGYNLRSIEEMTTRFYDFTENLSGNIFVWHDFSKETWCFHVYPNVEVSCLILSKFTVLFCHYFKLNFDIFGISISKYIIVKDCKHHPRALVPEGQEKPALNEVDGLMFLRLFACCFLQTLKIRIQILNLKTIGWSLSAPSQLAVSSWVLLQLSWLTDCAGTSGILLISSLVRVY